MGTAEPASALTFTWDGETTAARPREEEVAVRDTDTVSDAPTLKEVDEEPLSTSSENLKTIRKTFSEPYVRRLDRGTRGNKRPVGRSEVIYCSLEEEFQAIINDPGFQLNEKSLSDGYKQLMMQHQRAGCTITLANGQDKILKPREEMGQISRLLRQMCRLNNPVLDEFRKERDLRDGAEIVEAWREHYLSIDNSLGLTVRRRIALWQTKWALRLFGNTTRPPRC